MAFHHPNGSKLAIRKHRIYRGLGLFFFGLGGLGIGVPLLPTVPLWILAAIFFARSAPALQQRIYDHPQFGETVRHFVEDGALSKRTKLFAIAGSSVGTTVSLWLIEPSSSVVWVVTLVVVGVIFWLATRPEPS
jgi:uncharacterized membrane protein YbaN (DUF454 family)